MCLAKFGIRKEQTEFTILCMHNGSFKSTFKVEELDIRCFRLNSNSKDFYSFEAIFVKSNYVHKLITLLRPHIPYTRMVDIYCISHR